MKWLSRLAWGLLTVVLLALTAGVLAVVVYRDRVLPETSGVRRVSGPHSEIRIERDAYGIPTIRAGSLADVMFGLGYVHAQDRLWQLETHRRIGSGELAEAFGPGALDTDRFIRALGVKRYATAQWQRLAAAPGDGRDAMLAYSAGVNEFIHHHLRARPPEFIMLGLKPHDWTPADSTAWAIMMAWDLGGNWSSELLRMRLAQRLPVDRIGQLLPPYPGEAPLPTADYVELYRQLRIGDDLGRRAMIGAPESGIEGVGSNNWAVDGRRSATGMPLLANDPHLHITTPALWYFARLEAPGFKVAGATMPGLPAIVLGQNERIAWGFTNTGPDVQDLYLERIKPDDPGSYQTPDGWARFETHDEVIKVKGEPDEHVVTRSTRHGPVLSDSGVTTGTLGNGYALSMRWTALDADAGTTLDAMLRMDRARSVDEFIAASAGYVAPMQNMVVADASGSAGRIARVSAGRVPIRSPANDLKGQVPQPGWDARYDWTGFIDASSTPREIDPPSGWLATANQRIVDDAYPFYLTNEWVVPYRYKRIEQMLAATQRHSIDSFAAMQADVTSLEAQHLLPWLKRARSSHPLAAVVAADIAAFDGTMSGDKAAPAIFQSWAMHLTELMLSDELGPMWKAEFGNSRSFRDAVEAILDRDDTWWCDKKDTLKVETCADLSDEAFTLALEDLSQRLGRDPTRWRWSDLHVSRAEHRPFSRVPLLARWFELRAGVGGDTYTVNVSRVNQVPDRTTGEMYLSEHAPSLRALYDLRDRSNSRFMHSSGQSGIVLSPLYGSFLNDWVQVRYVPVWPDGGASETLVLRPR